MQGANFYHVDVFASAPLSGNGLVVFLNTDGWTTMRMHALTREMKQFESIFLSEIVPTGATARVFTVDEELPVAGHPLLGAAAVLHRTQAAEAPICEWNLKLPAGQISLTSQLYETHCTVEMNQGLATMGSLINAAALLPILTSMGLKSDDLVCGLSSQVVSTGLPYLILPVVGDALRRARITGTNLESLLATHGAKFVLVLDVAAREIRTWDNLGQVEDVATGSAAGPAAAFLIDHCMADPHAQMVLVQGRFAHRPSKIQVSRDGDRRLLVRGDVWPVSHGLLEV